MTVAFLNDTHGYGVCLAAFVSPKQVLKERKLSGDLVFDEDGSICQEDWWLFPWEASDPKSYARRQQQARLSLKNFRLIERGEPNHSPSGSVASAASQEQGS